MRLRHALLLTCLLAGFALATGPIEAAKSHKNFVLHNDSQGTINAFYFSPSNWDDWGANQLAGDPLEPREWIWNRHNYRERYYDMRVEFDSGYWFEIEELDLTEVLRVFVKCNGKQCWAEYAYE